MELEEGRGVAKHREFFTWVNTSGDRARVRFLMERGRVRRFTVQYETWIEGQFRPVVRFDNADGVPHRDVLGWDETTVQKDWDWEGAALDPGQALNLAIEELRRNWEIYKDEFVRRRR